MNSVNEEHRYKEDSLNYAMQINGQTTRGELGWLFDLARSFDHSVTWVEVGSWCGRSLLATGMGLPVQSRLISVDMLDGRLPRSMTNHELCQTVPVWWVQEQFNLTMKLLHELKPNIACRSVVSTSLEGARKLKERKTTIDVVFIDADHEYDSIRQDIEIWSKLIRKGGIICGHDFRSEFPGVQQAVQKLLPNYQCPVGSLWVSDV